MWSVWYPSAFLGAPLSASLALVMRRFCPLIGAGLRHVWSDSEKSFGNLNLVFQAQLIS